MRTLVVDVAAETSGAITILNEFYNDFLADSENEYVFCVSIAQLSSNQNIIVKVYPWVKKSWFHRLWFDFITAPKLLVEYGIDRILSLQNTVVPRTKIPQTLYLHQSLPFETIRFSLFREPLLWVYQNIISVIIYRSLKKATRIIVQNEWMKSAIVARCELEDARIEVIPPSLDTNVFGQFDASDWDRSFFYPATSLSYKNHVTLLKAVKILINEGISDFSVALTLNEFELGKECKPYIASTKNNLVYLGVIPHQQVMDSYCKSVLVFPSYIESHGLPLMEAKLYHTPIIVADKPFSREVLKDYDRVFYFAPLGASELANIMRAMLEGAILNSEGDDRWQC